MKEELLQLRNQLKMGHRISFAEAMLLQKAIDILVNKAGNSPAICIDLASGPDRTVEVRYVAPPGYVMVPKEPTKEMIDAGWLHYMGTKNPSSKGTYKAMLAAAPQSPRSEPATVPGKWIPVSERLPFDEIVTLPKPMGGPFLVAYSSGRVDITWFSCWQDAGGRCGKWDTENTTLSIAMKLGKVTHWMPLPAAPQEVK